jgi:enterobactin synthetase component D
MASSTRQSSGSAEAALEFYCFIYIMIGVSFTLLTHMRQFPIRPAQADSALPSISVDAPGASAGFEPFASAATLSLPAAFGALRYYLARFEPARFSASLFDTHQVAFPPALRNSVAKRQAEFLAGRLCARLALDRFGLGHETVVIGSRREPLWPQGYLGSITHNARYAAALVHPASQVRGLGIDIETRIDDAGRAAMLGLVVCDDEVQLLRSHATLPFDDLLTLVFSAKESFYKAAFAQVQAFFDYEAVRVIGIDELRAILRLRCAYTLSPGLPEGFICDVHFEWIDAGTLMTAVVLALEAAPGGD